ncbi:unnamed protein product [Linum trigynum]|uniref:Uncharacterized protein n=1 Tax=Linum trigynum TaxID=586398 RepID=A0AAV2E4K7_9ROSI
MHSALPISSHGRSDQLMVDGFACNWVEEIWSALAEYLSSSSISIADPHKREIEDYEEFSREKIKVIRYCETRRWIGSELEHVVVGMLNKLTS